MYGLSPVSSGSSGAASTVRKQPTAPWSTTVKPPAQSDLLRAALSGRRFFNEAATTLDLQTKSSGDYRKLFALNQGLSLLESITNRAGQKGVSASETALLAKRFDAGMAELSAYLKDAKFDGIRMVEGESATKAQTGAAVARDSAKYVTGAVHTGTEYAPVEAFQGDVKFNISVKTTGGTKTIAIDLAEMGAETRTMQSVVAHINGKLEAAGVQTRMSREMLPQEPKVIKSGDKTITLPAGPDKWALSVKGVSTETVSFVPVTSADAVYVVQGSGKAGGHDVLKFQEGAGNTTGELFAVNGQIGKSGLPEGVETVRASAVGPDGSMWIVADVSAGTTNQPIKGQGDVVLMKLDSAGQVVLSRALGAASTASGYAISVSDDGRVAVAGSVIGALEPGASGAVANVADSFVTVFDAKGVEQWTQRRGAKAADEATAVSFGADGRIYVAGRSQSAMSGATASGGWDGYVQAFSETQLHALAPIKAVATGVSQFGTAGDDSVQAMTVDGDKLYTAGIENGRMVVRRFQIDATGSPTLLSSRDLGSASGGEISGLSVVNGQVILAGATRNGALDIGQINTAHAGGMDAFVAVISDDLTASAADRLTYHGGAGDDSAADVKIVDGKVWLTGVSDRPIGAKATDPTSGYLARLDPLTGAVEWKQTWTGADGQAAPTTIAVASGGASVLDKLGLPQGEIPQSDSKRLVDATALRAGDRFYVSSPTGRSVAVTIDAKDTLQTLARKIETASGRSLKVTIKTDMDYMTGMDGDTKVTAGGVQRLSIAFTDGRGGATLRAGEAGRDALAGLGLTPGYIGPKSDDLKTFGLDLPKSLNLRDAAAVKNAHDKLGTALVTLRAAYRALLPESDKPKVTGEAPAYLQAQLANYQAALARLTG
ncbi:transcriptional regulator [Brevundimonas sp. MYb46]|nr:transcriptional regulator [Brevundimonas sp. MYb31]PRA24046.1 transcriptional regulator [Brevundimonas sp. MYb27]PRB17062.1 transcriptional regulator [Brevundimonas sp. MYb52]PRB34765.1 transcriptional regulator [Brevundimonas sp. MYb46]PRB54784.1 transcriptional regulator [Brevundimonas sp. MYb33]